MKTVAYLLALICFSSLSAHAQHPDNVAINSITQPTCGSNNGKFTIQVNPAQTPALYESSIDGGVTWFQHTQNNAKKTYSNKPAGMYRVQVRKIGTTTLTNDKPFILRAEYNAAFTATPTAASACNGSDGKIKLAGIGATDSVSWLSSIHPVYRVASSLDTNTIVGLKPGAYYVIVKKAGSNYCYSTKNVTVSNSGAPCPAPTFCGNAQGANLFPNGTFGNGESTDGPALPTTETTYGYSQLASGSPDDGFYAISSTSDFNGAASGGNVFSTWSITTDHTGNTNGYMMIVNASYDQDIVTEKVLTNLCPNKTYQFSAWVKNLLPNTTGTNYIEPNLTFLIDGVGRYTSGNIAGNGWIKVGFTFKTSGTSASFSIRNNNPGGSGNDWAIDDIYVGTCAPDVALLPIVATCQNPPTIATAKVTDISRLYQFYQWQVDKNDGNGFVNIGNPMVANFDTANSYTVTTPLPTPITTNNVGWKYRINAGTSADDLSSSDCSYTNTQVLALQECGVVILPIKLLGIKANKVNSIGQVTWQVAEQVNVKRYELEKSTNGTNFITIAAVATKPVVGSSITYSADDVNLGNGITYYRVKVIDLDGKYAYSPVVTLAQKESTSAIRIFPNPASDRLYIWLPLATKVSQISVFDAAGRMVQQHSNLSNSTNVTDVDISQLPTGFYTLRIVTNNNEISNQRFIKK